MNNKKIFFILMSVVLIFVVVRVIIYATRSGVTQESVLFKNIKLAAADSAKLFYSYNPESYEKQMSQLVERLVPELRKGIVTSYNAAKVESFMYDSGFRSEFCVDSVSIRKISPDTYAATVDGRQVFIPVSTPYTVADLLIPGVDVKEEPELGIFIKSIYLELRLLENDTKFVIVNYIL